MKYLSIAMFFIVALLSYPIFANAETVRLDWDAPTSGGIVEGYNVYYGLTNVISEMTKISGIQTTYYNVNNLEMNKLYYFYVKAYNSHGEGPASDVKMSNVSLRIVN